MLNCCCMVITVFLNKSTSYPIPLVFKVQMLTFTTEEDHYIVEIFDVLSTKLSIQLINNHVTFFTRMKFTVLSLY